MKGRHRMRNGLNEWNAVPAGYARLPPGTKVQGGDVQRINDEYFCEYPYGGLLVGGYIGEGGAWYRKEKGL